PNGPFDPIAFTYPDLGSELVTIFRSYTGNEISLTEAVQRISRLLPAPLTVEQMDRYLDASFATYTGVPDLIEWCLSRNILFMLNTTGTQAYFQRVLARGLLPRVPVVAANPMIRFQGSYDDECFSHEVLEITDKPRNTEAVMRAHGITPDKVIVIGDSGGDGAHFAWGARSGAFLIGSMTKDSLNSYCRSVGAQIDRRFGVTYGPGEKRDSAREMSVNFMDLAAVIEERLC
ncbi:MAG: hypothetical protein LDL33_02420, partial [Desulfomonile sp.]|nr:hypothetical protein [Desulfomonile sp.]